MPKAPLISRWATDETLVNEAIDQDNKVSPKKDKSTQLESRWATPTPSPEKPNSPHQPSPPKTQTHRPSKTEKREPNSHKTLHNRSKKLSGNEENALHSRRKGLYDSQEDFGSNDFTTKKDIQPASNHDRKESFKSHTNHTEDIPDIAKDFASRLGVSNVKNENKYNSKIPNESEQVFDSLDDPDEELPEMTPAARSFAARLGLNIKDASSETTKQKQKQTTGKNKTIEREKYRQQRLQDKSNRDWDRNKPIDNARSEPASHFRIQPKAAQSTQSRSLSKLHTRWSSEKERTYSSTPAPPPTSEDPAASAADEERYKRELAEILDKVSEPGYSWADDEEF